MRGTETNTTHKNAALISMLPHISYSANILRYDKIKPAFFATLT